MSPLVIVGGFLVFGAGVRWVEYGSRPLNAVMALVGLALLGWAVL